MVAFITHASTQNLQSVFWRVSRSYRDLERRILIQSGVQFILCAVQGWIQGEGVKIHFIFGGLNIYKTKTVARMPDVLQLNLYLDPMLVSRYLPCNLLRNIITCILFYFEAVSEYRVVVIFYIFQCSDSTGKHDEIVRYVVGINK